MSAGPSPTSHLPNPGGCARLVEAISLNAFVEAPRILELVLAEKRFGLACPQWLYEQWRWRQVVVL
jgi:hypothetical protein